jgi:hypothetical protein
MNNINICDYLKAVVKNTVKHYARDYKIDEARIKRTAKEVAKTGRHQTFLWFARECGTYMGLESEVIKRNTPAYTAYKYYDEQDCSEAKTIKAYLVTVTGIDGKTPIGTVSPLNYAKECDHIRRLAVPANNMAIDYAKGTVTQPVGTYVLADYPKLGHIKQVSYLADDDKALEYAIAMLHNAREAE